METTTTTAADLARSAVLAAGFTPCAASAFSDEARAFAFSEESVAGRSDSGPAFSVTVRFDTLEVSTTGSPRELPIGKAYRVELWRAVVGAHEDRRADLRGRGLATAAEDSLLAAARTHLAGALLSASKNERDLGNHNHARDLALEYAEQEHLATTARHNVARASRSAATMDERFHDDGRRNLAPLVEEDFIVRNLPADCAICESVEGTIVALWDEDEVLVCRPCFERETTNERSAR
jgi:hypothetical protein